MRVLIPRCEEVIHTLKRIIFMWFQHFASHLEWKAMSFMRMDNTGKKKAGIFILQPRKFSLWFNSCFGKQVRSLFLLSKLVCPFLEITYDDIIQVQLGKIQNFQLKSGFSSIFISPGSHSYFLQTLSLVTQSNLISYHISSTKSI